MSALRNILQRCVRNASILGRSQLCLQHNGNFNPIYSDPTYISRKAYSNTVNESAENATHSAQESHFGKTGSKTTQQTDIPDDKKISLFSQILNLDKYSRMFQNFFSPAKAPLARPPFNKNLNLRKYYICVRDLSKETTPESLREFYSQFGEIASCDIILEGKPKERLGNVAFTSKEAKAQSLNSLPHCIDGKEIKIINIYGRKHRTLQLLDLSPKTTPESLKAFYSRFGPINRCRVTEKTYGIAGKVTFAYQKDMNRALDFQPHVIDGSEVFLKYATFDLDLLIEKMPEDITEETLCAFYSKYGQLRQCRLVKNETEKPYAFVSYSAVDEVNRAMNDRPHLIGGKPLKISFIGQGEDKVSLFIGSLPENVTGETLRKEFSKYGKPIFWKVENDGRYNQSGAYGFVSYAAEEEALKALNSGPHTIQGTVVDVRKSNEGIQASEEKSDD